LTVISDDYLLTYCVAGLLLEKKIKISMQIGRVSRSGE